jgi:hypothetical protein
MILHLVLKKKWYDMISSGEKKEEYREIKPYWIKRLSQDKKYDVVCFHLGYTNTTLSFLIESIEKGVGNPKWGAEPGKEYFVIKLGK